MLADEGEEVTDGLPVELDGLVQWQVGDRMLHDLQAGRTRQATLDKEWRRGVLPPGQLGWRLAQKIVDQAAPVADSRRVGDPGRPPSRRATSTSTSAVADGCAAPSPTSTATASSRSASPGSVPRHLLEAWVPLLALCADSPGRAVVGRRHRSG